MDSISDLIAKIKTFGNDFVDEMVPLINKFDVYFNYERDRNNNITRVILRLRKNNNIHPLLYYYCNGCVIDTLKWKAVSVPPMAFNKRQVPELIESYYKQGLYDVLKVIDGTVVTFYYWNNYWNISSSNSYDVSSFYWIGDMTYAEIIYDLFTRLYPDTIETNGIQLIDNNRLDFCKLQKNKSYTIGFRHHNFHPIKSDPECMWNIQNVHLSSGRIEFNDGIQGLPNQQIITAVNSLDQLNHINKSAMADALRQENPVFNYGFILRSKNQSITKEFSNILLSSTLLKKIKKNIYEYPANTLKQFITHTNRFEYITMKNFFNKSERNEMIQLCPQMFERFPLYSKCINDTVLCTLAIMKNKQTNTSEPLNFQTCIITLAYSLLKHISKFEALDPFNVDTESILKDYYSNIEYSVLFLNAINKYKYN